MRRPFFRIAVEPRGLQAGLHRADHIGMRIIADVQHPCGVDAGHFEQPRENARVGFGGSRRDGGDMALE